MAPGHGRHRFSLLLSCGDHENGDRSFGWKALAKSETNQVSRQLAMIIWRSCYLVWRVFPEWVRLFVSGLLILNSCVGYRHFQLSGFTASWTELKNGHVHSAELWILKGRGVTINLSCGAVITWKKSSELWRTMESSYPWKMPTKRAEP